MVSTQILALGRALGQENVGQLRQLVRAVRSRASKASIHLDYSQAGFQKMLQDFTLVTKKDLATMQDLYSQVDRNIVDVVLQRFGKSGKITLNMLTKNAAGENIAEGAYRIVGNSSGVRAVGASKSDLLNMSQDLDLTVIKNPNFSFEKWVKELVKKLGYSVDDGVAKIDIPTVKSGGVTLKTTTTADVGFVNKIAKTVTNGECDDFGTVIQKGKELLG